MAESACVGVERTMSGSTPYRLDLYSIDGERSVDDVYVPAEGKRYLVHKSGIRVEALPPGPHGNSLMADRAAFRQLYMLVDIAEQLAGIPRSQTFQYCDDEGHEFTGYIGDLQPPPPPR